MVFDLFQLDDDPFQYPKIAGADDYLIEAAQANNPPSGTFYDPNHAIATERLQSLGVTEHWNNPVDRKYSGNLGTGKGIELLFIDGTTSNKRGLSQATIRQSGYSIKQLSQPGMVEFSLPKSETVTLTLFDDQGKKMGTILDGKMSAGNHRIDLFQRASKNLRLSSRSYVIVLNSNVNGISKSVTSLAMAFLR